MRGTRKVDRIEINVAPKGYHLLVTSHTKAGDLRYKSLVCLNRGTMFKSITELFKEGVR